MLKKFSLKNYKNFKDEISIDFGNVAGYQFNPECLTNGLIGKMLIYGRNATGKTNLGKALMDINSMIFNNTPQFRHGQFLNADSTESVASFSYEFQFDNHRLFYKYTRSSSQELQNEELLIDGKNIYKCDFVNKEYSFANLKDVEAETAKTDIYLQALEVAENEENTNETKLPFLRWLISNVALKNDALLLRLSNYVSKMNYITVGNIGAAIFPVIFQKMSYNNFFKSLEIQDRLEDFEDFLNGMGVECKLVLQKLPDGQLGLYFKHERLVPFYENASSGTLALVDLYRKLISKANDASLVYLDEFDAFYHYEMSEMAIEYFKRRYPKTQIIMTSHNTNLMTNRLMRPDCMFILSRSGTLTSLCNATSRELREGHNLEKMYISGEFDKFE